MLYILLFRQNSLGRLILLILLVILVSYMEINPLNGKRIPSNNNNCEVKVFLSSKREKRKVTKTKKVAIITKQMK